MACNCVSEDVAAKMALEITALFSSNWGIGITGYASLVPEENVNELFAFVAFAFDGKVVHRARIECKVMAPADVQQYYVNETVKLLGTVLTNDNNMK
jgi:nicotinamide mononucleotide (NMN) deamidase PncC